MYLKKAFLSCMLLGITSLNSCKDQGNTGGLAGLFSTEEPATPTEIHSLADLEGKRVGALTGGMFPTVLKPLQPGIAEYKDYKGQEKLKSEDGIGGKLETRTDITDAMDTLIIGVRYFGAKKRVAVTLPTFRSY